MNKADLRATIRDYLNRPTLSDSTIDLWIAATDGELQRILDRHPRNRRLARHVNSSGEPQHVVQLPEDCMGLMTVVDQAGNRVKQYSATGYNKDTLQGFALVGNAIHLKPALEVGEHILIVYQRHLPALTDAVSANWVLNYYADVYLYGALKEAAVYLKDDARLALWQTEFGRRAAELRRAGWNERMTTAPQVILRTGS